MNLEYSNPEIESLNLSVERIRENIEDNKAFLSLIGVSKSVIEEIDELGTKWFHTKAEEADKYIFVSSNRVDNLISHEIGISRNNNLYNEIYNLLYCHYSIRYNWNNKIKKEGRV